jgi:hypothetical protein
MTAITPIFIALRCPEPRRVELVVGLRDQKAIVFALSMPQLMRLAAEASTAVFNWMKWEEK